MEITDPISTHSSPPTAFGATLAQARQRKNVSLDEAANELHILKRHLEALEQEDFSELPQEAFARGFAINYAKFLDLDPVSMGASFDAVYPKNLRTLKASDIESPLRPMGTLQRDGRSKIRFNLPLIIAVIGLIVLAVFLLRMVSNASSGNNAIEENTEAEVISPSEQAQGAAVTGAGIAIGVDGNNVNATNTTGIGNSPVVANTLTPEQLANTASSSLELWVKGKTDISIVDGAGNRLMTGIQARGSYSLSGKPPFRIDIKNVKNVDLNLDKQPISLKQYATNNQANFILTP